MYRMFVLGFVFLLAQYSAAHAAPAFTCCNCYDPSRPAYCLAVDACTNGVRSPCDTATAPADRDGLCDTWCMKKNYKSGKFGSCTIELGDPSALSRCEEAKPGQGELRIYGVYDVPTGSATEANSALSK